MIFADITPVGTIILVAGVFCILALLISKISCFIRTKQQDKFCNSAYECGFKCNVEGFSYANENLSAISMFLILELAVVWFLFCCVLNILNTFHNSKLLMRFSILMILVLIIFAYKIVFIEKQQTLSK